MTEYHLHAVFDSIASAAAAVSYAPGSIPGVVTDALADLPDNTVEFGVRVEVTSHGTLVHVYANKLHYEIPEGAIAAPDSPVA